MTVWAEVHLTSALAAFCSCLSVSQCCLQCVKCAFNWIQMETLTRPVRNFLLPALKLLLSPYPWLHVWGKLSWNVMNDKLSSRIRKSLVTLGFALPPWAVKPFVKKPLMCRCPQCSPPALQHVRVWSMGVWRLTLPYIREPLQYFFHWAA